MVDFKFLQFTSRKLGEHQDFRGYIVALSVRNEINGLICLDVKTEGVASPSEAREGIQLRIVLRYDAKSILLVPHWILASFTPFKVDRVADFSKIDFSVNCV